MIFVKRVLLVFFGAAGVLFLGLVLLLATSGYWLPWAVPGLLRLADAEVDSVRRAENGDLVVRGVRYGNPAMDLSLAEFRSPMPLPWLWHGWRGNPAGAGEIRLDGLEVRSREGAGREEARGPIPGPGKILGEAERWLELADRWLPPVSVGNVAWIPPEGGAPFVLAAASFRSRGLDLTTEARAELPALRVTAAFPTDDPWDLRVEVEAWDAVLRGRLERKIAGSRLAGDFDRKSGVGTYFLEWRADVWTPSKAAVEGTDFQIPEGMGGLPVEVGSLVVDSLEAEWDGADYAATARVRGGPAGEALTLDLAFDGDLEKVLLRKAAVTGSWARLTLGGPVRVDLATFEPETPLRFSAFADLSGQDFFPVRGEVSGTLEADAGPGGSFPLRFALAGGNLVAGGRALRSAELEGRFAFPELMVESLRVVLPEGSSAEADGSADLETRTFSLRAKADLEAADLDSWAGRATGLEGSLVVEAEASGPWERPDHGGTVRVGTFTPPGMVPLALDLDWEGEGAERLTTNLRASAEGESLRARAQFAREGAVLTSRFLEVEWRRAGRSFLVLAESAEVRLDFGERARWPWQGVRVGEMRLTGEGRELGVRWDPPGAASLAVVGLKAGDFAGWLPPEVVLPEVSLESVSVRVEDFEPVLIAESGVRASWRPDAGMPPVQARVRGRLDERGLKLAEIRAAYDDTPMLSGELTLPVTLHPWSLSGTGSGALPAGGEETAATAAAPDAGGGKDRLWRIVSGGELGGSIASDWSAELRELIHDRSGAYLENADLELSLGGTGREPEVHLAVGLRSARLDEEWAGAGFPEIRDLQLVLRMDSEKIRLTEGLLELRDSGIRLTGELPYPELLREYEEGKRPDVRKVLGHLRADAELRNWDAAVWRDRLPDIFRPQGKITGTVGVDPGLVARGEVGVSGFSLRPTLYSPPVDDIHATLLLEDRTVRIADAGASVSGGRLSASGTLNLEDARDPHYEIRIGAENVPVVRTPDMILRTDADLTFARARGEDTPLLRGELNLRNSTYLINFDPFSPNIETGPGTRPPYFSVEAEPFAGWRCDLAVEGRDFLRVRSALFSTELSASLRLTRTLGNPLLLGSVRADGGRIRFPGMSMRIESAEAFIAPGNPNLLRIEADAIGQNRFYVVTMNASGSAENPRIEFSSTPSLTNAQIIRLLATGSLEGGGAGAIGLYLGQALLGPGTGEQTLADRLSVEVGQEVTENGRSTVEVIYRLNDRWSVEGEYDRYDTYNLNLVRKLLER